MSPSRGKARRSWPQRLIISFNVLVILAALVFASGLGYFNTKLADVQRLSLSSVLTDTSSAPGDPQNFLIVGTDSDLGLDSTDAAVQGRGDVTGARSDTIMILNVNPKTQQAAMLSLPRDLWVKIAGERSHQKINAALGLGGEGTAGPEKLIETIQQNFRIPINHYIEIDFAAFERLVGSIGGVPIYFNTGVRDVHSGLVVEQAGCKVLTPPEALAYARSRHLQYLKDPENPKSWVDDPSADFGRISRQQDFVKRVLKRAISKGVRDPLIMNDLVNSGVKSVRIDDELTAGDLLDLGGHFRSFDPDNLDMVQLPAYGTMLGGAAVVLPKMPEAEAVLNRFRIGESGESEAVQGLSVQVLNGTGRKNEATKVSAALSKIGFQTVQPSDNLGVTGSASLIQYHDGQEAEARLLARHLDSKIKFERIVTTTTSDQTPPLILTTGSSFARALKKAKPAKSVPGPTTTTVRTTTPSSTIPGDSSTTSGTSGASTSTTSTTVPGFVPGPAPPGVSCG